jgi:dienelactone hydrolase
LVDYGEIDVVPLELVDGGRATPAIGAHPADSRRVLPTTVYLPPGDEAAPLILLAHGYNGHPRKFTDLARYWAAAGYAVAVPRFPVSSDEFPDLDPELFEARLGDLEGQAADLRFVVDAVRRAAELPGQLRGRVDAHRLGLFGLSLGSLTVWSALAAHLAPGSVTAVIQSDGAFPGTRRDLAAVGVPVLIAHSDCDPIFPLAGRRAEYDALRGPKCLLVLHGAAHASVGENTPTPADASYRAATAAFWDRHVRGLGGGGLPPDIRADGVTTFVDGS